ncbi:NADH-quinone oxidoreductase subunit E [Rhizobium aquaticum]|uniref:NADH-quinone oxidoreductase subunit E n=1 Tax=Rhizobium aquaticum TaxID=1549636 RepID=A0ABV2IW96_9HYPH
MSVRRLADDNVQPQSFAFNEDNSAWAAETIKKYPAGRQQSAVIPLLMRAQEQDGWVTRAAIEKIADMLEMPYIRVLEVATFYTQFQIKPVGTRAHVQVCGTTPCMLRGAEDLIAVCKKKIHHDPLHTNESGTLSWEEVECQGACVNAPMVVIFKDTYEDLTPTQLEYIIDRFEAGKGGDVTPGPQIDRVYSAPAGAPVTLTTDTPAPKFADRAEAPVAAAPAPAPVAAPAAPVAVAPAAKAEAKPSLDDPNRPAAVEKPATPDDLKMISGVGPVMEAKLHDLGIYTFAQIAKWTEKEVTWVDGYLAFRGRIVRDDWIKQADALARGGEEEYVRVFGKKPR